MTTQCIPQETTEKLAQLYNLPVTDFLDDYNRFLYEGQAGCIRRYRAETGLGQKAFARKNRNPIPPHNTAYTEFGCPGASDPEYIRQYISGDNYADCTESNSAWTAHDAFGVWYIEAWLRRPEVNYFFGGFSDTDDLCKKMQFLQTMCYRSYFEEMRKQWPHCAMALNWCFNEPWPTVANNSLLSWPAIPKPCYYAVQSALRPQLASLRIDRHLWWAGEHFCGEIWLLNDALQAVEALSVIVSYRIGEGSMIQWGVVSVPGIEAQNNRLCGTVSFPIPQDFTGKIHLKLSVENHPEMDSEYTYLCRAKTKESTAGMLNV